MGHLVLGISSQYEQLIREDVERANWLAVGYFLLDTCVGMISALSTQRADFMVTPLGPMVI